MLIDDIGIEEPSPLDNLLMKETPYEASLMPTASSASLYTPAFEFVENNTSDGIKTAAENGNADAKRVAELLKKAETLVNQSGVGKRASGFFDKIQKENKFGLREDGTPKSTGFLGVLKNVDGKDMTELSMGVEIDGKEVLIPSIVPTLTKEEINYLVHGGSPLQRESIQKKAVEHARKRIKYGQSPFAGESEESKLTFKKPIDLLYDKDRFWEMYDRAERVQIHDLDPEKLLLEKDREAYHKVVPDFLGTEGQLNLLVIQDMRKDANKLLEDNKISHEKWQQIKTL
jgi:hypothetical protein